jgi:predicted glycoside hydrolase/deacetylase ChbG (UPF0249 family)
MTQSKKIILCADDFGLNPGICEGILGLVANQRLSAVSCMVNTDGFSAYANELIEAGQKIQLGMHFNLTEGQFLSEPNRACYSLRQLLINTHLGLINSRAIAKELNTQLDYYIQVIGRPPDFIDGHQHVHQFPFIRKQLLRLYEQRLRAYGTSIRSVYPLINHPQYQSKGRILALTGGRSFRRSMQRREVPHAPFFAGVYDFSPATDYRGLFRYWLSTAPDQTLIMCHPGEHSVSVDPIAKARQVELNYFASDVFLQDCLHHRVSLAQRVFKKCSLEQR